MQMQPTQSACPTRHFNGARLADMPSLCPHSGRGADGGRMARTLPQLSKDQHGEAASVAIVAIVQWQPPGSPPLFRSEVSAAAGAGRDQFYEHEAVFECSAFGLPDERLGETVGLAAMLKPGASTTQSELLAVTEPVHWPPPHRRRHRHRRSISHRVSSDLLDRSQAVKAAGKLAAFKMPVHIELTTEQLPRGPCCRQAASVSLCLVSLLGRGVQFEPTTLHRCNGEDSQAPDSRRGGRATGFEQGACQVVTCWRRLRLGETVGGKAAVRHKIPFFPHFLLRASGRAHTDGDPPSSAPSPSPDRHTAVSILILIHTARRAKENRLSFPQWRPDV